MAQLFVISAPSGTGKTSLIQKVLDEGLASKAKLGVSCTTREKRKNEEEGIAYFFLDEEEFNKRIDEGNFLEYAKVFGNLYGTPKDWVESTISQGFDVILELDVQGAIQVKNAYPDAKTIFIIPPSYEDLKNRLNNRGQDSEKTIEKRLSEAKEEVLSGKDFDYLLTNDDFDLAFMDLKYAMYTNSDTNKERESFTRKCLSHLLEQ
jgi:guanylate kinase